MTVFAPTIPIAVSGAAWIAAMISVPILGWTVGPRGTRWGISLGVVTLVAFVATTLGHAWPAPRVAATLVLVPAAGWLAEFIGSSTGVPFGRYHYTDVLQPQIAHVPVIIPLAWLMMMPSSWAVAQIIAPSGGAIVQALIGAAAFTAWDLYLDPQFVRWDFWRWEKRGFYEGIPASNFAGWFVWAFLISLVASPLALPLAPLVVVYALTWLMQAGGQLLFWRMPVPALVGFVGMGIFAIPALLRLFGSGL